MSAMQDHSFDEFSQLIESVYQAPYESPPWTHFLETLRHCVLADVATLVMRFPTREDRGVLFTAGGSSQLIDRYRHELFKFDDYIDPPQRQIVSLLDVIPEAALEKNFLYQQCLKPAGIYYTLSADTFEDDKVQARLFVGRSQQKMAFSNKHRQLFAAVLNHLQRSLGYYKTQRERQLESEFYASAMDKLALGTILLDRVGTVLNGNQVAWDFIQTGDGMVIVDKKLQLKNKAQQRQFENILRHICLTQRFSSQTVAEAMRIKRCNGSGELQLLIKSISAKKNVGQTLDGQGVPAVALFITNPDQHSSMPRNIIKQLFGFTEAESALAVLMCEGKTVAEAADQLGVSKNTVNTHIKSLYAKTGVCRQTKLVRLLNKSVASLA